MFTLSISLDLSITNTHTHLPQRLPLTPITTAVAFPGVSSCLRLSRLIFQSGLHQRCPSTPKMTMCVLAQCFDLGSVSPSLFIHQPFTSHPASLLLLCARAGTVVNPLVAMRTALRCCSLFAEISFVLFSFCFRFVFVLQLHTLVHTLYINWMRHVQTQSRLLHRCSQPGPNKQQNRYKSKAAERLAGRCDQPTKQQTSTRQGDAAMQAKDGAMQTAPAALEQGWQ